MQMRLWKYVLLSTVLSLSFVGQLIAENRMAAYTVTPMVGYHMMDGALKIEDGASVGVAAGYNVDRNWTVEADLRYTPTEAANSSTDDVDVWTLGLGGLYHFQPTEPLVPYLSFGLGGMIYDFDGTSHNDEDYMGYYGGGFKYSLDDRIALRLDLKHILDARKDSKLSTHDDKDWRHHLQAMLGLTFQLSGYTSTPAQEARTAQPLFDEQSQTTSIDSAVSPVALGDDGDSDSDGDGVLNAQDRCPETAPGVRVTSSGCPSDTDMDGVLDFQDACIDTPQGATVDQQGCEEAVEEVASLTLNILFGFDKAQVTPFHYGELSKAADFIGRFPNNRVVVEGHTDNVGDAAYNRKLSQQRAENVLKVLIEKYRIDADRISAIGFGPDQPVASNANEPGQSKNRRVEISILP
ncbi:MAG: OmpA family protein [Desulfuromonadales bacterium]|nr:OmpA family protein [Desulfuromonadales bacterium]